MRWSRVVCVVLPVLLVPAALAAQPAPPRAATAAPSSVAAPPAASPYVPAAAAALPPARASGLARPFVPLAASEVAAALKLKRPSDVDAPVTLDARTPYAPSINGSVSAWHATTRVDEGIYVLDAGRKVGPYVHSSATGAPSVECDAFGHVRAHLCGVAVSLVQATERSTLTLRFQTAADRRYLVDCAFSADRAYTSRYGAITVEMDTGAPAIVSRSFTEDVHVAEVLAGAPERIATVSLGLSGTPTLPLGATLVARELAKNDLKAAWLGCRVYPTKG